MRDGRYHQGKFHPRNPQKYKGDANNIVYRSSWEIHFMRYCDRNDNIIEWGSEEFFIPYFDPTTRKVRRYFPDFIMKVKDNQGRTKTYVVEVKPQKQTIPPKETKNKEEKLLLMKLLLMKRILLSGRQQKNSVKTENLNLKSLQNMIWVSNK